MKLRVDGLEVQLDGRTIVSDVALEVASGEVVGLVGPNGSGKSTLLRTVYRVLRPSGGAIALDSRDLWRERTMRQVAREVAAIVQERPSEFGFTAAEIVAMGRIPHPREAPACELARARAALARVGLPDLGGRLFATLSGGEKQRVLVARALVQEGRLLVLDEPTNHLDVHAQLELLALVRELRVSVLTVLHDLNLAAAVCDRLYVLHRGRVVAAGPPENVLAPDLVERVFRVRSVIGPHPLTGRPHLAFAPLTHRPIGVHS